MTVGTITYGLRLISHKGFGLGDVKWFSAISMWLTPWEIICFFYVAFCVGSLYLLLTSYRNRYIPFGPFSMLWWLVLPYMADPIWRCYING